MKKLLLANVLGIFFTLSVSGDSVFYCEAKPLEGNRETLKMKEYTTISPIIVIDEPNKKITYSYNKSGRKWTNTYEIITNDGIHIAGKNIKQYGSINHIHFQVKEKLFTIIYAGEFGNTMTFGNCQ